MISWISEFSCRTQKREIGKYDESEKTVRVGSFSLYTEMSG